MDLLRYYSRKDVQKAIFESSINREIAVKFGDRGFGKRPDILQYESDVYELAKQGATSFNISEERWKNPLLLKPEMTKKQLDELRTAWDLIIDIDGEFEYSKIASHLIIEALKFHNMNSYSLKFSGNRGFHIAVPFESFPSTLNKIETRLLFPESARIIASYLREMIKDHLIDMISEKDLAINKDPFSFVNIDNMVISSRHTLRAPYSYNEKSGLISIPIKDKEILNFNKENAKPENVKTNLKFLDLKNINQGEASQLIMQAYDWHHKTKKKEELEEIEKLNKKKDYKIPKIALKIDYFPPCVKTGLINGLDDGKKRFLFILLNFLRNAGYDYDEIKNIILEWNKKNREHLRENYIISQLNWHKRQKQNVLPQNCPKDKENLSNNSDNIYIDIGICNPDHLCKLIKNPVNYSIRKSTLKNAN